MQLFSHTGRQGRGKLLPWRGTTTWRQGIRRRPPEWPSNHVLTMTLKMWVLLKGPSRTYLTRSAVPKKMKANIYRSFAHSSKSTTRRSMTSSIPTAYIQPQRRVPQQRTNRVSESGGPRRSNSWWKTSTFLNAPAPKTS